MPHFRNFDSTDLFVFANQGQVAVEQENAADGASGHWYGSALTGRHLPPSDHPAPSDDGVDSDAASGFLHLDDPGATEAKVPVVASNGDLYLCDDQTWDCIPW